MQGTYVRICTSVHLTSYLYYLLKYHGHTLLHSSYIGMNVCGSAYENGCVVDGTCATAAD